MVGKLFSIADLPFDFSKKIGVMGILNLTPDSFSDGGDWNKPVDAVARALQLEAEGADFLDIGAESTRPNACEVSLEEERKRLFPVLEKILSKIRIPISLDTRRASIAQEAIGLGVSLLNDVSAFSFDPEMLEVLSKTKVPFVLMHQRGNPQTMMQNVEYEDIVLELLTYFQNKILFLESRGIAKERIILDPGIGFAKKGIQNLKILANLKRFSFLDCPILVGLSRKSFLQTYLEQEVPPKQREELAEIAHLLTAQEGANILRVHDVKKCITTLNFLKDFQEMRGSL